MSQTGLKMLALVLMLGDHIGKFIPDAPFFLQIAGRISAPLFVFCAREGFRHTKNKKTYILRLYIFNLLMGVLNRCLAVLIPTPYRPCNNNIFSSLFIIFIFIYLSDLAKEKQNEKRLYLCFAAVNIIFAIPVAHICSRYLTACHVVRAVFPTIFTIEGDILIFAMGLVMYRRKGDKKQLYQNYLLLCTIYIFIVLSAGPVLSFSDPYPFFKWLFCDNIQWMQILAIVPILCYNNKRGRGLKYLFYRFYPTHLVILYITGNIIYQM